MRRVAAEREAKRLQRADNAELSRPRMANPTWWNSGWDTGSESGSAIELEESSASEIEVSNSEDPPVSEYSPLLPFFLPGGKSDS